MFCINCGKEISNDSRFCRWCGTQVEGNAAPIGRPITTPKLVQAIEEDVAYATTKKLLHGMEPGDVFTYTEGEYAYVKYVKDINNNLVLLKGIDDVTFIRMAKSIVEKYAPDMKIGSYTWVKLSKYVSTKKGERGVSNLFQAQFLNPRTISLQNDFDTFTSSNKPGTYIKAPVVKKEAQFFEVEIGPKITARVGLSQFSAKERNFASDLLEKGKPFVKQFRIGSCTRERESVKVKLFPVTFEESLLKFLPPDLYGKNLSIPPTMLTQNISDGVKTQISDSFDDSSLRAYLNSFYLEEKKARRITIKKVKDGTMFFDLDLPLKTVKEEAKVSSNGGAPLSACFKKAPDKPNWVLSLIGFSKAAKFLERDVRIPDWSKVITSLSNMALYEKWDLHGDGNMSVLRQYLLHTYYKALIDGLVQYRGDYGIFNTGLVDKSYNPIFFVMTKIEPEDDSRGREWEWVFFTTEYSGENSKTLNSLFEAPPSPPQYIRYDNLREIIFNPDYDIMCDYKHIIYDNLSRLPTQFILDHVRGDDELVELVEKFKSTHNPYYVARLKTELFPEGKNENNVERARIFGAMEADLKQAVEMARRYCRWNYKTAIPIYYPRNNGLSLILPLKLHNTEDSKDDQNVQSLEADVALVVQELTTKKYQGETILTMEMAYQDARQICRPNSEWLTLKNAKKTFSSGLGSEFDDDESE